MNVKAKLRFSESKRDQKLISFVSMHPVSLTLKGCKEDAKYNKAIVIPIDKIRDTLTKGVQYECELIRMNHANGYIAISATPVVYDAEMEVIYVKKCLYQINIKWGNQKVLFDPKDGRIKSVKDEKAVEAYLRTRLDIKDSGRVADEFAMKAHKLRMSLNRE